MYLLRKVKRRVPKMVVVPNETSAARELEFDDTKICEFYQRTLYVIY